MNNWANEQFVMHNMMGIAPHLMHQTHMIPPNHNLLPQNQMPGNPVLPGPQVMPEQPVMPGPQVLPGPQIIPGSNPEYQDARESISNVNQDINVVEMQLEEVRQIDSENTDKSKSGKDSSRNRESSRERDRRDHSVRSRENHDRNRDNSSDRYRDRRDRERDSRRRRSRSRDRSRNHDDDRKSRRNRPSKFESDSSRSGVSNMMLPGSMMPYSNMESMMVAQHMEMPITSITNMQMMQGMGMMPNINNMANNPNMMDQNMMLMNQQMQMMNSNQPIYVSVGVILPPLPNVSVPTRREKPLGCRTIFVGGLPKGLTEDVIHEIFQRFGTIDDIKLHKQGVCHIRFENHDTVENSFLLTGYRFKFHEQMETEATTVFIDYALNRDDQNEYERNKRLAVTPPRVEPFTQQALNTISEKIKSDNEFVEAAPSLASWLERGECNKKNANTFYSLIQASNNQLRRLFTEKMQIDEEYQNMKSQLREKFAHILKQFEQVAKILTAARLQRVSDHFSKQQRRNIEMWLKMTEELQNMKEEFNTIFEEDETERSAGKVVSLDKYEELKTENENLMYELEGYRNEAHLAKDEAERKFEKFRAHFVAQQALQNKQQVYPPLPPPPMPGMMTDPPLPQAVESKPPPPSPDQKSGTVSAIEAKIISLLTAFLMAHPHGATLDYLLSYATSMLPDVNRTSLQRVLFKYNDLFQLKISTIGIHAEPKWKFIMFDNFKSVN